MKISQCAARRRCSETPARCGGRRTGFHSLLLALSLLVIAGCETVPPAGEPVADPAGAWGAHRAALRGMRQWTAVGRVAITSSDEAYNASLQWRQELDRYRIRLSGPLGQGALELAGGSGAVQLTTSDRKVYTAAAPEALLRQQLGWSLPVSGLRYWVRGIPDPRTPVSGFSLDASGRALGFSQSGWTVRYRRYAEFDGLVLPVRVDLESVRVSARVLLTRWRLES